MNQPAITIARDLQKALELLRAGQQRPAHDLLRELIKVHPQIPDAHWLLAGLLFRNNDVEGAYRELHTTLQLAPRHASAQALLGEVLVRIGRLDEAERSFRQALALRPDHFPAAINLGYTLLDRSQPVHALELAEEWIHKGHETPGLLMLKGRALLELGRPDEAVSVFERMLKITPASVEGELGLATALTDSGKHEEAEALVRQGMTNGRVLAESHYVLARALIAQDQEEGAIPELQAAVRMRPDYVAAHLTLSDLVWMRTGNVSEACAELDAALDANHDLVSLRIAKGKLLEAAESPLRAIEELERGLAFGNDDFELCLAIAQSAIKCDPSRALEYAQRALRRSPENQPALFAYCGALLGVGKPMEAEAIAVRLHQSNQNDCHALALLALAWRLLDDPRYHELCDYRCVIPQSIDTPDGWQDLEAYLADLAAGLRQLHGYHTHPLNQSLRLGTQADLDFESPGNAAIKAFKQAIDKPIRNYMERIGAGPDELRHRNTGRYRLNGAWSVRLRPHGHHVNHIHPDGWLSSACYIELPAQLDDARKAGWIQFGKPPIVTAPPLAAEHFVKPQPGLLVLFPSYMWHGTIPFDGDPGTARMTIAFDVVPA